jgi:hypothetical protein
MEYTEINNPVKMEKWDIAWSVKKLKCNILRWLSLSKYPIKHYIFLNKVEMLVKMMMVMMMEMVIVMVMMMVVVMMVVIFVDRMSSSNDSV